MWTNLQGYRLDIRKIAMYFRTTGWQGTEVLAIVYGSGEQRLYHMNDLTAAIRQLDEAHGIIPKEVT